MQGWGSPLVFEISLQLFLSLSPKVKITILNKLFTWDQRYEAHDQYSALGMIETSWFQWVIRIVLTNDYFMEIFRSQWLTATISLFFFFFCVYKSRVSDQVAWAWVRNSTFHLGLCIKQYVSAPSICYHSFM